MSHLDTKEVKRLHDLGFAIHWLKAKSKAPIGSGWTTGPRKPWSELAASFRPANNVGVRLGAASKVVGGYLAVIDCDVKSSDPKHLEVMNRKLRDLFGSEIVEGAPKVASGRGGGSAHLYVRTATPFSPKRLAQSPTKVKVKMPSVAPSRADRAALSEAELAEGFRSRPAWEISLMGEGQQVVLPPSIHPDTGKAYLWSRPLNAASDLPLLASVPGKEGDLAAPGESGSVGAAAEVDLAGFTPVAVDLYTSSLSERVIDMLVEGKGCDDRSAGVFVVALAMVRSGFGDPEILSVLTDPRYYLGLAAYDHAKTKSRKRAAEWLAKYTVRKAREEADAVKQFEAEVEVSSLSESEISALHQELVAISDWRVHLERGQGEHAKPKVTLGNIELVLTNEIGPEIFSYNEFSCRVIYGVDTPWGGEEGREIRDMDLINIKGWLGECFRFEPATALVEEAVRRIAYRNRFHPVREYLYGLEWDGKERASTWLRDHLGAEAPEPYLSAVSRKVLVALVARILDPGCKFDQVLILEGFQGRGKSTALRHLIGNAWFSDAHIDIKDKDAVLLLQNRWLLELGELSGMRKADVDALKEFISRQTDRIRVPYGKLPEDFPRQCIFIGTTNRDEFLKDETGNRRYWPVSVRGYDFKSLERERDQLFAEAVELYQFGEPLYLEDEATNEIAVQEQAKRLESDILDDQLAEFFERERELGEESKFPVERFAMRDLFSDFGPLAGARDDKAQQIRTAAALRRLGFEKITARKPKGEVQKLWVKERYPSLPPKK